MSDAVPCARVLAAQPNLEYLRKEAKDRLGELRKTAPSTPLAEAQFQIARKYGFTSWRALKETLETPVNKGAPLDAYAGYYRAVPGLVDDACHCVFVESATLFLSLQGQAKIALERGPEGWFSAAGIPTQYGFTDMEHGKAQSLVMRDGWRRVRLSRIDRKAAKGTAGCV
jgi:hypothetical protein